ncbi:hypothetical protein JM18_002753 [Phytophthora kernoviae]|uniref:Lysine--tRNA ligase n=1 Tax=Phytophthora kernoviae TaxID=325452 RepID=A0A922AQJ8_9STRA|nr:hypothetical protein JM18_002753 [Phytophthora kernoviae]
MMMLRSGWQRHGALSRRLLSTAAPSSAVTEAMERFQSVPKFQQYPHAFPVSMSLQEYQHKFDSLEPKARCTEEAVVLAGRVVAIRHASKNLVFLDLQSDGATVQVLSEAKHFEGRGEEASTGDKEAAKKEFRAVHESLRRGDIIGVKGFPGKSGKGELSIIPRQLEVLAPCIQPFPNSKYGIKEPEIRFRKKYLDLLTNPDVRPIFETRAKVVRGVRKYLEDRNFVEVETPMLFSAAGGAAAQPFVTNSRALGKDLYLRIAPELFLKQLVIGGFDRVFEIGKVFRNEGIDATHNPEFTICEFYQAYADYHSLMDTAEEMISGIAKDVTGSYKVLYPADDGNNTEQSGENENEEPAMVEIDFTPPFKRLPILETLEECLGEKLPDVNSPDSIPALLELCERHNVDCPKPHTCTRLVDKLIGHFVEPKCVNPTFLYNHPKCMSPLAKAHREQEGVTERFELFVTGKELCNAYTELNDPFDQRQRFAAQQQDQQRGDNEAHSKDDEFCVALEYGLAPTGGFGIGIDRLVMLLSGKSHIREVIMFPAMKPTDHRRKRRQRRGWAIRNAHQILRLKLSGHELGNYVSIGFIGSGRLAERIARDLIKNVAPQRKFSYKKQRLVSTLLASDPSEERRRVFDGLGFKTSAANQDVLADCDLVFLGTDVREALARQPTNSQTLYVSLMGDLPALQVEELLCPGAKVIRMMPHCYLEKKGLPKGVLPPSSWATVRGSHVNDQDLEKVMQIAGISNSVEVDENLTSWSIPNDQGLIHRFVSSMSDHAVAASKVVHEMEDDMEVEEVVADFKDTYTLGRDLGSGMFSTVFKAKHCESGETYAVKSIKDDAMTQEGCDVLIAEVGALNRLKHPNIISHYGFYNEDGKYLLVLEYCNRGSLRGLIDKHKTIPEQLAKKLLKQTLSALEYCHSMGQVHRDVKAENILLKEGEDGNLTAKLADFGLSEELQLANRRLQTMCGTPQYLSPELVSGRLYGTPADIWSTGILAYMMLSGLVPFDEAKSDTELFKLISLGAVWYDQPEWNAIAPAGKAFVQSMLDISPDSRPTAAQLLKHEWLQDT